MAWMMGDDGWLWIMIMNYGWLPASAWLWDPFSKSLPQQNSRPETAFLTLKIAELREESTKPASLKRRLGILGTSYKHYILHQPQNSWTKNNMSILKLVFLWKFFTRSENSHNLGQPSRARVTYKIPSTCKDQTATWRKNMTMPKPLHHLLFILFLANLPWQNESYLRQTPFKTNHENPFQKQCGIINFNIYIYIIYLCFIITHRFCWPPTYGKPFDHPPRKKRRSKICGASFSLDF